MAIRATGLKINDKELQKFADRITEKYVDRYISAGNKAQKEIRQQSTIEWFVNGHDTMLDSLEFEHKLVQKNGFATIYFTSYVNMVKFDTLARINDPSIYRWMAKYNASIDPADFLINLQWNQGIHGLPQIWHHPNYRFGQSYSSGANTWINPYFNQSDSMESFTRRNFESKWESTVNKYLKK